jgi:hypothetical protein
VTVHDKTRLLTLGLSPNGLVFKDDAGVWYLPFHNVPFELETIVGNWLMALPPAEQAEATHAPGGTFKGLTPNGWEAFVRWTVRTLEAAQRSQN